MKKAILIIILLSISAWYFFFRCPSFPLDIGQGNPGGVFMETDYLEQSEDKQFIFYKVQYPKYKLTGKAKLDYKTNNFLLKEQDFNNWLLTFEYEKDICKYSEIPSKVNIYCKNLLGKKLCEELTLENVVITNRPEIVGLKLSEAEYFVLADEAIYISQSGDKIRFKVKYFDVSDPTNSWH